MAVTQYFTLELPQADVSVTDNGAVITFDRSAAISLWEELGEALGQVQAPVVTGLDTEAVQALLAAYLGEDAEPVGRQMTPDEALARMQVESQLLDTPAAVRNPGTGIGNG